MAVESVVQNALNSWMWRGYGQMIWDVRKEVYVDHVGCSEQNAFMFTVMEFCVSSGRNVVMLPWKAYLVDQAFESR